MIVVKVELHSAITKQVTLLGSAVIHNVGTSNNGKLGDYDVLVARKPDAADLEKVFRQPLRCGGVRRYPRLAYNVWRLVIRALASAFPEERVPLPDEDSVEWEKSLGR